MDKRMAEIKKRTTKTKNEGVTVKSESKRNTAVKEKPTRTRASTVSGKNRPKQRTETKRATDKVERKSVRKPSVATDAKKQQKEDKSCKSCRFYVHIKKTIEGKEVKEPTCCFHWPMSNTKNMESECSLYIKWEGSMHGCQ